MSEILSTIVGYPGVVATASVAARERITRRPRERAAGVAHDQHRVLVRLDLHLALVFDLACGVDDGGHADGISLV